jgi:RNA polymerase sigma factor (sigma-70 family)
MPDWQEILDRDGPRAWRAAYRITGNRADADECLQEAFLGGLEIARHGTVRDWSALLRRLATARAVDRLRHRLRGPSGHVADWGSLPGPVASPSRDAEDAEFADRLRCALARLSPRQSEIFCLHVLDGCSYEEIARQTAVSVAAVGVHLHRARERLRVLLFDALDAPHVPRPGSDGVTG